MKQAVKQFLSNVSGFVLLLTCTGIAYAQNISKPDFVKDVNPDDVSQAGNEIWAWLVGIGLTIALLSCARPAYLFFDGRSEEALNSAKNILIGVIALIGLPSLVYGVYILFN